MLFQKIITSLKGNKKGLSGLIIIFLLIFVVIVLGVAIIFILKGGPFIEIGEIDYTYDSALNVEFTLDIYNSIGKINILYSESQPELLKATLKVFGRSGASLSDALNFTSIEFDSQIIVSFDSGNPTWNFFNKQALYQEIYITISPYSVVKYNLKTNIGEIHFDSDSIFPSIIKQFDVKTKTGSINVDFGDNTIVNTNFINVTTTIGSITFMAWDTEVESSLTYNITSTSGNINLGISYTSLPTKNYTAKYNIHCTSGNIELLYAFSVDVGLIINTSTTTGLINIPGGGISYQSPDIGLKTAIYDFSFITTTGNIQATLT